MHWKIFDLGEFRVLLSLKSEYLEREVDWFGRFVWIMNIFYVDENPELAARYHGDKHVVKMVLETAQLLSTAHHVLDGDENQFCQKASDRGLYRPSHANHPSST